jgi:hypothetical protein
MLYFENFRQYFINIAPRAGRGVILSLFCLSLALNVPARADNSGNSGSVIKKILLINSGGKPVGTGFSAFFKGKLFAVTVQDVLSHGPEIEIRDINGRKLNYNTFWIPADSRPVLFLELSDDVENHPYILFRDRKVTDFCRFGAPVCLYGFKKNKDTSVRINGNISGIGPEKLELKIKTSEVMPGGPVTLEGTDDVAGICVFEKEEYAAMRMDNIAKLKLLDLQELRSQEKNLREVDVKIAKIKKRIEKVDNKIELLNKKLERLQKVSLSTFKSMKADISAEIEQIEKFLRENKHEKFFYFFRNSFKNKSEQIKAAKKALENRERKIKNLEEEFRQIK